MDKNLHDIEDLFKKALGDNEENPSQNAWDGIEKKLDRDNAVSIKKKYNLLKKVALLLVFLVTGLSIYVWKNEDKTLLTLNDDSSVSDKETKIKNDTLAEESNTTTLQKPVDSFTINKSDNSKQIAKDGHIIIDKTILKDKNVSSGKSLNSVGVKNLLNTSIRKNIKFKSPAESLLTDVSKFSIQKKSQLIKRKSDEAVESKATNQIEGEQSAVIDPAGIQFDVLATKESLQRTALDQIDLKIPIEKTWVREPSRKSTNQSHFAITAFYSPDISFFHYENNDQRNSNNTDFKKSETENYSLTLGALIDYKISKQWGLQSGIALSTSNFDLESKTIYAQRDNSGGIQYKLVSPLGDVFVKPSFSSNPNIGDSLFSKSITHTLQYIGFPLSVKYNLHRGKFTLNVLGGVSANFLTRGQISTELEYGSDNETETTDKIYGLKPFYFNGLAGIGLDYHIYKKLSLSFSPTLRFALSSINRDVTINSYPNSVGFLTGLKIKL
jgi:hypothetical protein